MAIEVQLFTASHVFRGFIETSGERLSDILNLRTEPGLVLSEVQSVSLFNLSKSTPVSFPKARIEKRAIQFAIPVERDITHKSIFRKANRVSYEIAVVLPQFELAGTIHMIDKFNIRQGLATRTEDFIPLTDATATYLPNPQLVLRATTMVINKQQIEMVGEPRAHSTAPLPNQ